MNGAATTDYAAVVFVELNGRLSTGSVIGDRTVLVAGHAVPAELDEGTVYFGSVIGTSGDGAERSITVERAVRHRYFGIEHPYFFYDVGLLRLAEPAAVPPMTVNTADVGQEIGRGDRLRLVGFGAINEELEGAGTKRTALIGVGDVSSHFIEFDDAGQTSCNGDSGGPVIANVGGEDRIVALVSTTTCRDRGANSRIDRYWGEFVEPTVRAFEAECPLDGTCDAGCASVDPDCDNCAPDGVCGVGCEQPDLDCPLRKLYRELCEDGSECESGICAQHPVDGVGFCSYPCVKVIENDVCGYDADCVRSEDPRNDRICVPDHVVEKDDGWCSAGGRGQAPGVVLLLLAVAAAVRRRRARPVGA